MQLVAQPRGFRQRGLAFSYEQVEDGTVVIEFERTIMVYKRAHAPQGELIPTPNIPVP